MVSLTARLQLMIHFTLRSAIPRLTRELLCISIQYAKPRDRLRCLIGSLQTAWMMGSPEEQRSRPFAVLPHHAKNRCVMGARPSRLEHGNGEGMARSAQGGAFRRTVTHERDTSKPGKR